MTKWLRQRSGWIALTVLAAIYYPFFGKGYQAIALYAAAGRCIWHGEALLPCQPMFSYQPALAALLLPFAVLPAPLQKLVWYAVCVGSLVLTVRLTEAMAERLYPGATRGRNLIWLRTVSLFLCSKHIPDVLNYQAYEAPALAMITLGMWALTVGREALGGFWLAAAAAIRATPLIYLPYLLLKRRYLACVTFVACFVAIGFLPDVISALRGGHTGYIQDWVRQVAGRRWRRAPRRTFGSGMPGPDTTSTRCAVWSIGWPPVRSLGSARRRSWSRLTACSAWWWPRYC